MEVSDPKILRVLINPVRADLLYELAFAGGAARVTDLARILGKPVNSISYHLGQLAKVGLITKTEPADAGDSRESWYRLTDEEIRVGIADRANHDTALRAMLTQLTSRENSAVSRRRKRAFHSPEVDPTRLISASLIFRLTEAEEQHFRTRLETLLQELDAATTANQQRTGDDTSVVYLNIESFPLLDPADDKDAGSQSASS